MTDAWKAASIHNPQWELADKVHDWRNYVPPVIREMWDTFNPDQLSALYDWADDLASNEHWE